jgi:hypothetical protein
VGVMGDWSTYRSLLAAMRGVRGTGSRDDFSHSGPRLWQTLVARRAALSWASARGIRIAMRLRRSPRRLA